MAFIEIEQSAVQEGAPFTQNFMQIIKDNFDAHELEIQALHKKAIVMALILGG